jgi:glucose/arabinose dehydrogenase
MIYDKNTFPKWKGSFFVTSLTYNVITRLEFNGATVGSEERLLDGKYGRLRLVTTDSNGFIYVLTDGPNAKLLRIAPLTEKSF